jgi:CO/xanthine dehydrogenase Mo-binding subunit
LELITGNLDKIPGMTYHLVVYITRYIVRFFSIPVKQHKIIQGNQLSDPDQPHLAKPSGKIPIGGSELRLDSVGKVTGKTRYAEDMVMPGMLHAAVFRSPYHHARLLSLDTQLANQAPGIVRIITALDIPGENNLTGYSRNEPILAPVGDTLRQKGAPIALVVADTLDQARQAVAMIEATLEPLPYLFDAEQALQTNTVQIYPAGNVLNSFNLAHGDLQAAWEAADTFVETDYYTAFQEHSTLERETTLGYIDDRGRVTVIGGTHEPHWQQGFIAQAIGLAPAQVHVIVPPTGGSFGARQDPWPLIAAGLMAFLLRCPVRLAYSRGEVFDATPKRHPYHVKLKIGARTDGSLTGIQVRINANTGGYDSAGYWIPNYAVTASGGPYRWQAVDAYAQTVYTNAAKCGQFRGFGTPQSIFALECTLDELAQKLNLDPLSFRLQNSLIEGVNSFLGYPVGESFGFIEVLEAIRPRYYQLTEEAQQFNSTAKNQTYRMGVGLAGMWYRFGKSGVLRVETHAELALDGHFKIYCSAPDYGQGISTVMVQLAAQTLGIPRQRIELVNADTALTPDSDIQGASRATYFVGSSVVKAAENLKREIFATAAEMLDLDPVDFVLKDDCLVSRGKPSVSIPLTAIASEFEQLKKSRRVIGMFDLSEQFPDDKRPEYIPIFVTGAQLAQVVVDMETGLAEVWRVVAAHDVGHAINRLDAVGQIEGAVVMGVGTALMEEYLPGVSSGFTDYILPMIYAMPQIEVILVEVPSWHGPFGAKGLGEAAILPTAPAIINAIARAVGLRIRSLPASPGRLLEAIQQKPFSS